MKKETLAYIRTETSEDIIIVYKSLHLISIYALCLIFAVGCWILQAVAVGSPLFIFSVAMMLIGFLGFLFHMPYYLFVVLPLNRKLAQYQNTNTVTVTGSKLSLKSPITYIIKK